jgi:hypothetical protein
MTGTQVQEKLSPKKCVVPLLNNKKKKTSIKKKFKRNLKKSIGVATNRQPPLGGGRAASPDHLWGWPATPTGVAAGCIHFNFFFKNIIYLFFN